MWYEKAYRIFRFVFCFRYALYARNRKYMDWIDTDYDFYHCRV